MRFYTVTFTVLFVLFLASFSMASPRINGGDMRASFSEAIEIISPAVVNIYTEKTVAKRLNNPFVNDPFFNQFFENKYTFIRKKLEHSLGSGVILTSQGYMVTNYHVIKGADAIKVVFKDGREVPAIFVNADKNLDIAVMKLQLKEGESVPYAIFADSDSLKVGDVALAIGNPFGVGQSVSMGVVSALNRTNERLTTFGNFIQTDAAINPGNSGGALVDSNGLLIGINTAIFTRSGASNGIGFATPANLVKVILDSILTTGKVSRPWFGATGQDLNAQLAERFGLSHPQGVLLNEVAKDSPADRAGVRIGDILLKLDGKNILNTRGFNERLLSTRNILTRPVPLTVYRNGKNIVLQVHFVPKPPRKKSDQATLLGRHPLKGYTVEILSPTLNQTLGLPINQQGVVIINAPKKRTFFGLNLRKGDLILEINNKKIKKIRDLKTSLQTRKRQWKIKIQRGQQIIQTIIQ